MAHTPGFFGFYLGPTTERQHQGIRAWRRENVDWIFTSPCILAAFGHGAASCPLLLWKSAACQVLPKLPFFALSLGAITASPACRCQHLILIFFNSRTACSQESLHDTFSNCLFECALCILQRQENKNIAWKGQ